MNINSRTFTNSFVNSVEVIYQTSEPQENDWGGQLPISRQPFQPGLAKLIDGIYIAAKPPEAIFAVEPELLNEFSAWETASDEALLNFESELD